VEPEQEISSPIGSKQNQEASSIAEPEQETVPISPTMLEEPEASSVVHVLTVSQQAGEGKYTTIGAALADARPLTRIEVQPGIYREKVLIDKDVELVGMGEAGSVTLISSAPCLTLQALHAQVQNVKIQAQPVSLLKSLPCWSLIQRPYAAVEITTGSSLVNNCEILAGKIGVRIHGTTASPVIKACRIHDHMDTGIIFAEGASGLLIDSFIYTNKRLNIEIVDGSHPLIIHSQISQSRGKGIYVHKGGRGRVAGCDITENRSTGVEIAQQSSLSLMNCSISRNRGSGIIFTDQGGGNLIESDIAENELHGIEIKSLSFPHIEHCRLRQGKGSGIVIDSQGKGGGGFIGNCELDGHASVSILIQNASNPYIRACNIHDGQSTGLEVRQGASATIDMSTITSNNASCAEASGKGTSLIMNNVELWQQGETQALRFVSGSYGQMDSCRITASSSTAVEINNHALVYLRLCIIKSTSFALQLRQGSKAKVEGGSFKRKDATTSCDETSDVLYVDEMQAQSTLQ
jgi:F-box protein 11